MAIDKIFDNASVDGIADNLFKSVSNSVLEVKAMQQRKAAENVQLVIQALKKIESDIQDKYDGVTTVIEKRVSSIKDGRDGRDGVDGKAGKDGRPGRDGATGLRGIDGKNGVNGVDGDDGVSVVDAHIDFDGSLIIGLSSGRAINVGEVVAPDLAEKIKVITNGGGTSQSVLDTLTSLQNQINLISSALVYKGTWNASTNTPTLASGVGTANTFYIVSVAGTTTLNGVSNWGVGDWATFNGTIWQRVEGGAAGNFTDLSVSGTTTLSGLTASTALALDASKNVVSVTNTGTGNNVLATSPTLVTPALGTPSSGTVTNLTGTASININGTVGATTPATGAFTTVNTSGNVNFGATAAASSLGSGISTVQATGTGTGNSGGFRLRNSDGTKDAALYMDSVGFHVTTITSDTLKLGVGNVDYATISSTGLAVTGTLSATGKATVGTGVNTIGLLISTLNDSAQIDYTPTGGDRYVSGAGIAATNDWGIRNMTDSRNDLLISGTGAVTLGGTLSGGTSGTGYSFSGSAPATSLTLDSSGNLGIGTTGQVSRISASGSSATDFKALTLRNSSGTVGSTAVLNFEASSGTEGDAGATAAQIKGIREGAGTNGALAFWTSLSGTSAERMRISSAGIVTMSAYGAGAATFSAAGVISSVSDETWKIKDGVPVDPDSMLKKLEPGYWYYNDEKKETFGVDRQLGFYAQNVNAAIGPEAAPTPEEGKPWGYYDRSVLAVTVMSLQKALATIELLTARITALETA